MNAQATATSLAALTEKAVGYARDMVLIWRRHPEVFPENAQADIRIADHISKISAEKAIPAGEAMTEDWLAGIIREQIDGAQSGELVLADTGRPATPFAQPWSAKEPVTS